MKRFLAIAITVVLLIGAIVVLNACSGGRELIDGAVWELSEDGKSYTLINLEKGYAETSYTIPETIDGKPVTAIADSAFAYYFPDLVSITIPESVKYYGKYCFYGTSIEKTKEMIENELNNLIIISQKEKKLMEEISQTLFKEIVF